MLLAVLSNYFQKSCQGHGFGVNSCECGEFGGTRGTRYLTPYFPYVQAWLPSLVSSPAASQAKPTI